MAALVSSPLLESTDSGRGHDKRAEPRSIYSSASSSAVSVTEARIRATAQQLVTEKAQSAKIRDQHLQMEAFREQQVLWYKNSEEQLQHQQLLARQCEALQLEFQERQDQPAVAM